MQNRGFTDRLAVVLVGLLIIGMLMSFYLALQSIEQQYLGTLACWTVVFTPLSAGIDIVLNSIVKKNMQENTGADGEGIRYKQIKHELENGGGPTI